MSVRVKGVRGIRVFDATSDGLVEISRSERSKKKRKGSRGLRRPEKNVRVVLRAARTLVDELEGRHNRSSRKKKDGWVRDGAKNSARAHRKAAKELRKLRVV